MKGHCTNRNYLLTNIESLKPISKLNVKTKPYNFKLNSWAYPTLTISCENSSHIIS